MQSIKHEYRVKIMDASLNRWWKTLTQVEITKRKYGLVNPAEQRFASNITWESFRCSDDKRKYPRAQFEAQSNMPNATSRRLVRLRSCKSLAQKAKVRTDKIIGTSKEMISLTTNILHNAGQLQRLSPVERNAIANFYICRRPNWTPLHNTQLLVGLD